MTDHSNLEPLVDEVTRTMVAPGVTPDLVTPVIGRLRPRRSRRAPWLAVPALAAVGVLLMIASHRPTPAPASRPAATVATAVPTPAVSQPTRVSAPTVVQARHAPRPITAGLAPDAATSDLVTPLAVPAALSTGSIQPEALTVRPLMTAPLVVAPIVGANPDDPGSTR
jgi:hypothetical protein